MSLNTVGCVREYRRKQASEYSYNDARTDEIGWKGASARCTRKRKNVMHWGKNSSNISKTIANERRHSGIICGHARSFTLSPLSLLPRVVSPYHHTLCEQQCIRSIWHPIREPSSLWYSHISRSILYQRMHDLFLLPRFHIRMAGKYCALATCGIETARAKSLLWKKSLNAYPKAKALLTAVRRDDAPGTSISTFTLCVIYNSFPTCSPTSTASFFCILI